MSQNSQHTRSFVAKIITYTHICCENHNIAHFGREKKIGLQRSGRGSPFYEFFSQNSVFFFKRWLPYCAPTKQITLEFLRNPYSRFNPSLLCSRQVRRENWGAVGAWKSFYTLVEAAHLTLTACWTGYQKKPNISRSANTYILSSSLCMYRNKSKTVQFLKFLSPSLISLELKSHNLMKEKRNCVIKQAV